MSVRKLVHETDGIYFITITCFNWLPLFQITNTYDAVYRWFDYLKENGHYITGYVIMPNHIHALIAFSNSGKNINRIIGNGKRFLAYDIVKRLKQTGNEVILKQLSDAVEISDSKRGKLHEVFEDSFDIKECMTEKFIRQKLNYIHLNPCSGKWKLAERPEDYLYSSAKFYSTGEQEIYPVTHIMQLMDIDLSNPHL